MHIGDRFQEKLLMLHLCIFVISVQLTSVNAQSYTPLNTYNSASVFIEGKAMYIQSGISIAGRTQQAFSIDLSKPWNVASPLYTAMKDGIFGQAMPNALLADGETWFLVFNSTHSATYNLRTGVITTRPNTFVFNTNPGLSGVADPNTNNVIIPNGVGGTTGLPTALVHGLSSQYVITPSFSEMASYGYSMAWSKSANAAFVIGGMSGSTPSTFFGRWVSSVNYTWERINTPEDPSGREMACMVPAYNGNKLVYFGGRNSTASLGDIHVYDVLTSKWKQGSPGGTRHARSAHACAVSGDFFIAWGGVRFALDIPGDFVSIYNLATNTWVDQYVPPVLATTTTKSIAPTSSGMLSPATPNPTSELTPQPSDSSFKRIGIPIIATVAVAILASFLFLLYRRIQAKKNTDHPSRSIPLDHMDDMNARSLPPFPHRPDSASHHLCRPQQHLQNPIPYTAAQLNEHSPGSTHQQSHGNEVQAQELLLQGYESLRQRHLEEQRELEQQIEQQRADLQMMKGGGGGGGQREWGRPTAENTLQTERRGPQYWSMGSSSDREQPSQGWVQPQQPRGVQAYDPSKQI
ncbi:hypothetical protein BGZ93_004422 [Podila epicladia]|nr:hypothetical protein BGZ93_004422 [Podila epicladia]